MGFWLSTVSEKVGSMKIGNIRVFWGCVVLMFIFVISLHSCSSLPKVAHASPQILVDQFGYRPRDPKIAVIRADGNSHPKNTKSTNIFNVINVSTGESVYSNNATPWNQGKIHSQSGDIAWWFDFSSVSKPGRYIVSSQSGENLFRLRLLKMCTVIFSLQQLECIFTKGAALQNDYLMQMPDGKMMLLS
jgi:hypothetical protein